MLKGDGSRARDRPDSASRIKAENPQEKPTTKEGQFVRKRDAKRRAPGATAAQTGPNSKERITGRGDLRKKKSLGLMQCATSSGLNTLP